MIYELRQYTLRPHGFETLAGLFERHFVAGQEAAGIRVLAWFRDLEDPDRFVWFRAFADMPARAVALAAFYDGPIWRAHRDEANATMIDSDDVLLLRPSGSAVPFARPLATTVALAVQPLPAAAAPDALVQLETEPSENNFPRLPIRTGENVLVTLRPGGRLDCLGGRAADR